jgi:hypothetical protein
MAGEQPEGVPEGCVYFGPGKLLEDAVGSEGDSVSLYLATLDCGDITFFHPGGGRDGHDAVSSAKHVRKLWAMIGKRHSPASLEEVMRYFKETDPERIYDGLSEAAARSIIETNNRRLPLEDIDALLVNPEYLPAPAQQAEGNQG